MVLWEARPGVEIPEPEPEAVQVFKVDMSDRPVLVHDMGLGLVIWTTLNKRNKSKQWYPIYTETFLTVRCK